MKFTLLSLLLCSAPVMAASFTFSTGNVDGRMGSASRPDAGGVLEIETGDDFVLDSLTRITSASFTGLITSPTGAVGTVGEVVVEIYRVFPLDSVQPPSGNVLTRVNSPSDVAFDSRDSTAGGGLTFSTSVVSTSFTAANSVLNGINKFPNQTTNGEGPITGREVLFTINFATPLTLPAGHYFFVPQVQVTGGTFFWLSSVRPIVSPGTPFPAGSTDLQAWIRNENLAPDWSRIGTDIVGGGANAPTFNDAFTLAGETIPEPSTLALLFAGAAVLGAQGIRRRSPAGRRSK